MMAVSMLTKFMADESAPVKLPFSGRVSSTLVSNFGLQNITRTNSTQP
jgi:hypothetical protein